MRYLDQCNTSAVSSFVVFVFFQAEDGIRDLVRSRGLGDVYKRQAHIHAQDNDNRCAIDSFTRFVDAFCDFVRSKIIPVSYTHLTLPTSDLV